MSYGRFQQEERGVVSIHFITDSRANRSGAFASVKENAFRGTIGGPIDSKVYSINSSSSNGILAHGDGDTSDVEGSVRRESDIDNRSYA